MSNGTPFDISIDREELKFMMYLNRQKGFIKKLLERTIKKKILLSFMIVCISIFTVGLINVSAAKILDSGTCGENLKWTLDAEGTLTINGIGDMKNDNQFSMILSPWYGNNRSNIKKVVIGYNVTSIGSYAFYGCDNLTNITISNSVTSIGEGVFSGCKSLKSINVDANSVKYCSKNGILYNIDETEIVIFPQGKTDTNFTIPDSVTSLGDEAFSGCSNLKSITIPDSVTSWGNDVFSGCSNLTSITIPDSFTSLGDGVFSGCGNLTSITIPDGVTSLGNDVFSGCSNLTSITIPDGVTSLGNHVFEKCQSLTSIIIPDGVTTIGICAFSGCTNLKSITIPDGVTSIGDAAFQYCKSLTSIIIPDGVTSINGNTFFGCSSLKSITIPDKVTSIGSFAFVGCSSLTSIIIPDGVTMISYCAFQGCANLKSITIPDGVTSIDGYAFQDCKSLKSIIIPDKVTSIGKYAFVDCGSLTSVTMPGSVINIGEYAFSGCDNLRKIYYNGTEEQWKKISIDTSNAQLTDDIIFYIAYINLFDKDGNKISSKTQNMGETVDVSAIIVPNGYILKLYKDKERTREYSLNTFIRENLTLYADIVGINKLKISGVQKADIGQKNILQSVTFATDKTAKHLVCTVKYPEALKLIEISAKDFYVDEDLRETVDGYTYSYLTCTYKGNGNMPINKTLNPFDMTFDISENAKANTGLKIEILEDAVLSGDDSYTFDTITNNEITTNPILIQEMSIVGADEIDEATTYTVLFKPENATNKAVKWSVDDDTIATVSETGTLTPIKSGTVVLNAVSTDGSEAYAEKTVNVKVYAKISLITANTGVWNTEFSPETNEYILYVPKNTTLIKLTVKHSGTLKSSDGKTFVNNIAKPISIKDDETNVTLTYSSAGYTDSEYKITIVKFEGTKTTVSEDGKNFVIKPVNVAVGNAVVLALYDNEKFIEMQSENYSGADISFTTDKTYTSAKVMVWESLENMKPICDAEIIK